MITLAQAQVLTQDKLYLGVIDELRKDNLLDIMVFDKENMPHAFSERVRRFACHFAKSDILY